MTPPAPMPPPTPPPPTAGVGLGGLFLACLLMLGIAAVLSAAAKFGGWFWLGPSLLFFGFGLWFFQTRRHFKRLLTDSLHRHLADAADCARDHCHAAAIERYTQAGQLAARLHDSVAFAQAEQGRDAAHQAEAAAIERLAFVLYGLHAGRDAAIARLQAESVVNLTGFQVHDEVLEAVPSLPRLTRLHLRGKFITDKTLRFAAHARGLIELYLENTSITDEGLRRFRAEAWTPDHPDREMALALRAPTFANEPPPMLETPQPPTATPDADAPSPAAAAPDDLPPEINNLKFLHIEGAPITNAGLAHLAGFTALERLSLQKTKVTGASLAQLAPLKQLKLLSLDGPDIGDDALQHLARLPALERLELYATRLTGATLHQLAACPNLERLDLSRAPLQDSAVEGLARLTALRHLQLKETPLSPGAVEYLRTTLPRCQIAV